MGFISGLMDSYKRILSVSKQRSYFEEEQRKASGKRIKDLLYWFYKNHTVNNYYNAYGMDLVGIDIKECINTYVDERWFLKELYRLNKKGSNFSQIVFLKDKFLFYQFMKNNGLNTPEVIAIVINKELYDTRFNKLNANCVDFSDCFIKDVGGECASFVRRIKNNQELEACISESCGNGMYIIQSRVYQHSAMSALYSDAVNTLRIVTVKEKIDSDPYVLTLLLRVGTHLSGNVDNWAVGGLAIGIDEMGCLKEYGFYKSMHGTKTATHPDTGINLSGYQIPFVNEAKELVINAHKCLYNMFAIGWDVAITNDGPCVIEGNDNWEISLQQMCDRPLKVEWDRIIH